MEDVKEQCDVEIKDAPSSSSSKDLSKSLPEEAFNHFLQGKRHMLVHDYSFAVQSLGIACELYVKHFGELAIECGEVYFLYGKALFRLSQNQSGVLAGALNEAGSNEEDENSSGESENKENENESGKTSDADGVEEDGEPAEECGEEEGNEAEADVEEKEPSESTDSPQAVVDEGSSEAKAKEEVTTVEAANEVTAEAVKEPSESKVADDQVTSTNENKDEEPVEENQEFEDDLELAWNSLETAKSIFNRIGTVESQLKVAEILLLLAEISMETDNNASAIPDLRACLEIQKKHLKPDDRILAETYYHMGLAELQSKQCFAALENFKTTKKILELRRENLKNTPVDESAGSFASADKDAEISDLENILLDIQEKVEDTEELIRDAERERNDAFAVEAVASPVKEVKEKGATTLTVKPVSNISHLLKRKKPDDATLEGDSKRIKISVPNGDSNVTSTETTESMEGPKV